MQISLNSCYGDLNFNIILYCGPTIGTHFLLSYTTLFLLCLFSLASHVILFNEIYRCHWGRGTLPFISLSVGKFATVSLSGFFWTLAFKRLLLLYLICSMLILLITLNTFFLCLKGSFDFSSLIAWSQYLMRKAGWSRDSCNCYITPGSVHVRGEVRWKKRA